jgi:hypothetical protein
VSRPSDPATTILTAGGWIGLVLFLVWQEFFVEKWMTGWWFRVPATVVLGLVILVFALECLSQEMTVRRWATSVLVFGVFGALFVLTGIFSPKTLDLSRWVLIPVGAYYLLAAAVAGAGARDVF